MVCMVLLCATMARSHFDFHVKINEEEPMEPRFLAPLAPCYNATPIINSDEAESDESGTKRPLNQPVRWLVSGLISPTDAGLL